MKIDYQKQIDELKKKNRNIRTKTDFLSSLSYTATISSTISV